MEINNQALLEVYNLIKDHIIGLEQWGSTVLPIKNPRDIDIVVVCANAEQEKIVNKILHSKGVYEECTVVAHFKSLYNFGIFANTVDELNQCLNIVGYQWYFRKPLLNFKLVELNFNKDAYYNHLYESFTRRLERQTKFAERIKCAHGAVNRIIENINKYWYHLYVAKVLQNRTNLTFSEEEIENINILHDCNTEDDKYISLVKDLKTWLESLNTNKVVVD